MKKSLFTLLGLGFLFAQTPPDTEWTRIFVKDYNDYGRAVYPTSDGGYIITGYVGSNTYGYYDLVLIKMDANGNVMWQKTYGNSWDAERGYDVREISSGGYIITGKGGGNPNVWLIRTDTSGDTLWIKEYGGTDWDVGFSVCETSDKGYIIAGYTQSYGSGSSDVYLIRTDSSGNLIWQKTFGGTNPDEAHCVKQTSDGGYIIAGHTGSYGAGLDDVYLIKTDSSGNLLWSKTFGGSSYDYGYGVEQTSDGGYIVVGETSSFGAGSYDVYLIKTDPSGNVLWEKTFGGSGAEYGYSVKELPDRGYIITGGTNSFGVDSFDIYIIRTDENGNLLWEKTIGGTDDEKSYSIYQTSDGGYIIAGYTESFGAIGSDIYLIKLAPDVSVHEISGGWSDEEQGVHLFMGKGKLFLETGKMKGEINISIYNLTGRLVMRKSFGVYGNSRVEIPEVKYLSRGVYFLNVNSENKKGGIYKFLIK